MKTPRTFLYHAHGFAISGVIFRNKKEEHIPTQAMATLATTGGHAESAMSEFNYEDIVSFERAETKIKGTSPKPNVYETDMRVTIEGLNIMDKFWADKVVTHIHCTHTLGEFGKENKDRSEIIPLESDISGVKVNGEHVDVSLKNKKFFSDYSNYARLHKAYGKSSFREEVQQRFHWVNKPKRKVPPQVETRYKWAERLRKKLPEHGHILCTLVDDIQSPSLGDYIFGNMIVLPDFGTIYLGDYIVDRHGTRLEMVRVEIAKPFYGTIVDGGGNNGGGYPPSGG
jgi:hypothetical protein